MDGGVRGYEHLRDLTAKTRAAAARESVANIESLAGDAQGEALKGKDDRRQRLLRRVSGRLTVALSPDGKVEHFHFSIGTANEEAIGQELTT